MAIVINTNLQGVVTGIRDVDVASEGLIIDNVLLSSPSCALNDGDGFSDYVARLVADAGHNGVVHSDMPMDAYPNNIRLGYKSGGVDGLINVIDIGDFQL